MVDDSAPYWTFQRNVVYISFSFAIHYYLLKMLLLIFPRTNTVIPVWETPLHTNHSRMSNLTFHFQSEQADLRSSLCSYVMQAKGTNLLKIGTPQAFHYLSKRTSTSNTNCLPVLQQPSNVSSRDWKVLSSNLGFSQNQSSLGRSSWENYRIAVVYLGTIQVIHCL